MIRRVLFTLFILTFLMPPSVHARTWTSASEAKVEATFVSESWGTVTLKKEDGTEMQIRLGLLSSEDQTYIRSGKAAEEATRPSGGSGDDGEKGEAGANDDDALLPGSLHPIENYHAIITKPAYTAKLQRNGDLVVEITTRKAPASSSYILPVSPLYLNRGRFWYGIPRGERNGRPPTIHRAITDISSSIRPSMNPMEVTMTGAAEDGVTFEHEINFENDGICWSMEFEDGKDLEYSTRWAWGIRTRPTHRFDNSVELPAQKEATQGYFAEVKGTTNVEWSFWQSIQRGTHGVDEVVIHGVWPGLAVEINSKGKTSLFHAGPSYTGQPLYPGMNIGKLFTEKTGTVRACMTFKPAR